jgi:hypothetical protein
MVVPGRDSNSGHAKKHANALTILIFYIQPVSHQTLVWEQNARMPHTGNNYPRRKLLAVLPVFTMIMEYVPLPPCKLNCRKYARKSVRETPAEFEP